MREGGLMDFETLMRRVQVLEDIEAIKKLKSALLRLLRQSI